MSGDEGQRRDMEALARAGAALTAHVTEVYAALRRNLTARPADDAREDQA